MLPQKKRAVRYKSCSAEEQEETIFLHPSSALKSSAPLYVVYTELLATAKRPYMMGATSLEPQWLPHYAPGMCDFSKPLEDPKPHYSRSHDAVMCSVSVTFGPPRWVLPLHPIPFPDNAAAAAVFAAALLEGKVCLHSHRSMCLIHKHSLPTNEFDVYTETTNAPPLLCCFWWRVMVSIGSWFILAQGHVACFNIHTTSGVLHSVFQFGPMLVRTLCKRAKHSALRQMFVFILQVLKALKGIKEHLALTPATFTKLNARGQVFHPVSTLLIYSVEQRVKGCVVLRARALICPMRTQECYAEAVGLESIIFARCWLSSM